MYGSIYSPVSYTHLLGSRLSGNVTVFAIFQIHTIAIQVGNLISVTTILLLCQPGTMRKIKDT